jgi:hypothetical protein
VRRELRPRPFRHPLGVRANHGAIFTTCLESQLRPLQPSEHHISVCWDTARDVLRQATFATKSGARSPWSEVMRRPTSCTNDGEHPARFRVWMKNGGPESVPSTFNCFVPMIDWERRWRKFEDGVEPICVCEDAAREMGITR